MKTLVISSCDQIHAATLYRHQKQATSVFAAGHWGKKVFYYTRVMTWLWSWRRLMSLAAQAENQLLATGHKLDMKFIYPSYCAAAKVLSSTSWVRWQNRKIRTNGSKVQFLNRLWHSNKVYSPGDCMPCSFQHIWVLNAWDMDGYLWKWNINTAMAGILAKRSQWVLLLSIHLRR